MSSKTLTRIAGAVFAAALLTVVPRMGINLLRHHAESPKTEFNAAAAEPRNVARAGWDYQGPDDPDSFQKDVASLARREKPLIVMLAMPGCGACGDLIGNLHRVQDNHMTPLDFDVLTVDTDRYSRIVWNMRKGSSTPECFIYCGDGKAPVQMTEIPKDPASLVEFLGTIYHKTSGSSQPATLQPASRKL